MTQIIAETTVSHHLIERSRCPHRHGAGKAIARTTIGEISRWPKFRLAPLTVVFRKTRPL